MLVATELKGELARIYPVRACCRRAELLGLTFALQDDAELSTLDHSTARVALHLAAGLGGATATPSRQERPRSPSRRHRLRIVLDRAPLARWSWDEAADCDRRAFLRGLLLAAGSVSFSAHGAHVEFVLREPAKAAALRDWLAESEVRAAVLRRRGRRVVYIKGQDELGALLRLTGAHRTLLDLESARVGREVRNRLNRLLNAEGANVGRTVSAARRQLAAIGRLESAGLLARLPAALREAAVARRRLPEADLDELSARLGISRSATNGRLRRLIEMAEELDQPRQRRDRAERADAAGRR